MPVCVHAYTFRCVHARASCACVLLAGARYRVCGVLLVFSTTARNHNYFESNIARGQLYHCSSTLNVHQIDSTVGVDILYSFLLSDTMSEINFDEYGLSEKGTKSRCAEVCESSCMRLRSVRLRGARKRLSVDASLCA